MSKSKIYDILQTKMPKDNLFLDEPMSKHTSFKIGGKADIFVKITTIEELKYVLEVAGKERIPLTVIGNGTNLLVKDGGIRGIVLKPNLHQIEVQGCKMIAGSGVLLSRIAKVASEHALTGLEFASGIPRKLRWSNSYECWCLWRGDEPNRYESYLY